MAKQGTLKEWIVWDDQGGPGLEISSCIGCLLCYDGRLAESGSGQDVTKAYNRHIVCFQVVLLRLFWKVEIKDCGRKNLML